MCNYIPLLTAVTGLRAEIGDSNVTAVKCDNAAEPNTSFANFIVESIRLSSSNVCSSFNTPEKKQNRTYFQFLILLY